MKVVYALQAFPRSWSKAIFLAGPTPRAERPIPSWRSEALELLRASGYDGVVFVPEPEDGVWSEDYDQQIDWESQGLHFADVIVFWVPRDLDALPGFTTNVEFGRWADSNKLVLGHPDSAPKTRYLDAVYTDVYGAEPCGNLQGTLQIAVDRVGAGALRSDGERHIPLHLWSTPFFQGWYQAVEAAGNRLDGAEVRWVFTLPGVNKVFAGVVRVKVWVAAEKRHKSNEWIFGRTDISSVLLYQRPEHDAQRLEDLLATEVVLIREFRSPGRTGDGFVHELPGGSSLKPDRDPRDAAAGEVREETGLDIDPARFTALSSRQAAGTVSTHHVHLFAAALTPEEMKEARANAKSGKAMGNENESERTYLEVMTVQAMLNSDLVDWSTVGMVMKGLCGLPAVSR